MKEEEEYNVYQNEEEQPRIQNHEVTPSTTFEETLKYYKRLNISKKDIGLPQDFRHLQHVDCQSFDRDESSITQMLKQQNTATPEKASNPTVLRFVQKLKSSKSKPKEHTEEICANSQSSIDSSTAKLKTPKKQGRVITTDDIGSPQDFKHVCHVGWNSNDVDDAYLFEQIAKLSGANAITSNKNDENSATILRTRSPVEHDTQRDLEGSDVSISCPKHFRHVQHVSWDKDTGMVFRTESTEFSSTCDFVHEFITEYDKSVSNDLQPSTEDNSGVKDTDNTTASNDSTTFVNPLTNLLPPSIF